MSQRPTGLLSTLIVIAGLTLVPVEAAAEAVAVGVILPLSGPNAVFGHMQKNSMLMALEEVNRRGGVGGAALELDIRDTGNRPRDAAAIVNHFISDKNYPLILGGVNSSVTGAAAEVCQRRGTPFVAVTGADDALTSRARSHVFRIAPPRSRYPEAALDYVRQVVRPRKVAMVTEISSFGDAISRVVRDAAAGSGWEVAAESRYDFGTLNLEKVFDAVERVEPDVVFLTSFPPDSSKIMERLRRELPSTPIISLAPYSYLAGDLRQCGEGCRGVFNAALWWGSMEGAPARYTARYTERFGTEPDYHGAQAYAAVLVAAAALRTGNEREAVRTALERTRIETPYGVVAFQQWGEFHNQNRPVGYLFQWLGDRYEVIWPEDRRTARPLPVGEL